MGNVWRARTAAVYLGSLLGLLSCGKATATGDCTKTGCPAGRTCDPARHVCTAGGEGGGGGAAGAPSVDYPATSTCTVVPQAGCPAGHTCVVATLAGGTICVSAGTALVGAPCALPSDCALGLDCVYAACRTHCSAESDCPGDSLACEPYQDASGMKVSGDSVCSLRCNPADPTNSGGVSGFVSCPSNTACYALDPASGPRGSTDCIGLAGDVAVGGACDNTCAAGLVCLDDGTSKTCHPFCLMGSSSCSCTSFTTPQYAWTPSGVEEVGFCP